MHAVVPVVDRNSYARITKPICYIENAKLATFDKNNFVILHYVFDFFKVSTDIVLNVHKEQGSID